MILADAGYGADGGLRAGLTQLSLTYVVGVQPTLSVWRPGEGPPPPKPWRGKGRPTSRLRRDADHQPVSAKTLAETLAETLAAEAWHTVAWREGTNAELSSRFAAVRLRPAPRDFNLDEAHEQEWLLIEWPEDESAPTQYWLSTLPPDTSITQPASPSWSTPPNCAGGSSATTRNSSRNSAWVTTRDEVGAASTTTSALLQKGAEQSPPASQFMTQ